MPATARQTRKQIRQLIGERTGALWMDAGAPESSPSETAPSAAKVIDTNLAYGSDNEHRGKWVWATNAGSSTELRRVFASSPEDRSFTVSNQFSSAPSTAWTYELWDAELSPQVVHSYMNDAINEVTRKGVVHVEADSFHTGGNINAFGLDSSWLGVKEVAFRATYIGHSLAAMDVSADSLTANTTVELDSADYRQGIGSMKLTVSAGESSGTAIANSSFSAVDARGYDQLEFWVKTSGTVTSSNYVIQLMQGSSAKVEAAVPANSGDSWIYHTAAISAPESNSGITSVQVSTGSSDGGAATVWVDDVKVTRKKSGQFTPIPRDEWSIGQQDREVRLHNYTGGYTQLRITGVRKPNSLNSDSDVCEVDPGYIVSYVQGMNLLQQADNNAGRRDAAGLNANTFLQLNQLQRNRMSMPANIRWLDD